MGDMRSDSRPINESEVCEYFRQQNNRRSLAIWRSVRNAWVEGFQLKPMVLFLNLLALVLIVSKAIVPIAYGVWQEGAAFATNLECKSVDGALCEEAPTIDDYLNSVFQGTLDALLTIDVGLIVIALLVFMTTEAWVKAQRERLNDNNEDIAGFAAGASHKAAIVQIFDKGNVAVSAADLGVVAREVMLSIKDEIETLHPLAKDDVSNATLFIYEPRKRVKILARTDGKNGAGQKFRRKDVVGHYAVLLATNLTIRDFDRIPYKFKSLTNQNKKYRSILSIPILKKGSNSEWVGFITIDSSESHRFDGIREEIFNRIQGHIAILECLFEANPASQKCR